LNHKTLTQAQIFLAPFARFGAFCDQKAFNRGGRKENPQRSQNA
jgi:hypothetical protein